LDKFSTQLLERVNGVPYQHVMVIDGNDDRGIDVGVMTRAGYEITSICSHVDANETPAASLIVGEQQAFRAPTSPSGRRYAAFTTRSTGQQVALWDQQHLFAPCVRPRLSVEV
jgi:hypothetical protein